MDGFGVGVRLATGEAVTFLCLIECGINAKLDIFSVVGVVVKNEARI